MRVLKRGDTGPDVTALQDALRARGFDPGKRDGQFGGGTEAAVLAFQKSERLLDDGIVGFRTAEALAIPGPLNVASVIPAVTVEQVSQMFPSTPVGNIRQHLPAVLDALVEPHLTDKRMVLMALATIRAETEGFVPISEFRSRFNTSPSGHPFDLYDHRKDLGNVGPPDGERFRGRGFVQLTGRSNYQTHGMAIGLGDALTVSPERANEPDIAARLLASFLAAVERAVKRALLVDNLAEARRLVNGGHHGLDRFTEAFRIGERVIPEDLVAVV
jgi:putative chitinase